MRSQSVYDNPLVTRYASREMAELWGPQRKFSTWRRLWIALAEAEQELGLTADDRVSPRISDAQLEQLRAHTDDIDFARADFHEHRLRHDVMAHIHTYGEAAPAAREIIHLGATSCYVTDNTDLILMREGLRMLLDRLVGVIDALARFAVRWRDLPTLGFTHFQPAQLTTVGKRAGLWCYDFILDFHEIEHRVATLRFRGAKGATGTQASFLSLFHGDQDKVRRLDRRVAEKMGFDAVYPVTGQTYSRKVDSQVLDVLSGIGQTAHKFGTDVRLLAHRQEIDEPFEAEQAGSSAMPYKRNPMRSERMCGLARFLGGLAVSAAETAAVQWLERTLDDSVNRRLTLPQAFLTADAVLRLALNISGGLVVNEDVIRRNVDLTLPYMATENVMMAAVAGGGDRQELHRVIRDHSQAATASLKAGAARNDLLDRLRAEPLLARVDFDAVLAEGRFVGRAPQQVDEFIAEEVDPIRRRHGHALGQGAQVDV
ncbi:MAG TPA: adenylosuccinate lyase [Gemmataceae bacterium]|nr:adenylosuccinate lyase [Gemmataceae bacterium]